MSKYEEIEEGKGSSYTERYIKILMPLKAAESRTVFEFEPVFKELT